MVNKNACLVIVTIITDTIKIAIAITITTIGCSFNLENYTFISSIDVDIYFPNKYS